MDTVRVTKSHYFSLLSGIVSCSKIFYSLSYKVSFLFFFLGSFVQLLFSGVLNFFGGGGSYKWTCVFQRSGLEVISHHVPISLFIFKQHMSV